MDTLYEQERKRFEEESNRTESSEVSRDPDSALRPLSESSSNRSSLASLELDPDDRLDLSGMTIEQRKKLRVANVFRHMLKVWHFYLWVSSKLRFQDGLTEEQLIVFKKQADEDSANDADRLLNDLLEYKKKLAQDIALSKHFDDVEIAIVEVLVKLIDFN